MADDVCPMWPDPLREQTAVMDSVGLLIVAIGSFACLQLAAANLRGAERVQDRDRRARAHR
jgi:hypothetical protein